MSNAETARTKPQLPHVNDRAFRIQMRKVGRFGPLSMAGGYAAGAAAWVAWRLLMVALPWRIEERLTAWDWEGVMTFVLLVTVAPLSLWIPLAQYHLILDKNGRATVAKKQWWQRLRDGHVSYLVDAADIEFHDDVPWWQSARITLKGEPFAPFLQRSAVKRFRAVLDDPGGPPPPLY